MCAYIRQDEETLFDSNREATTMTSKTEWELVNVFADNDEITHKLRIPEGTLYRTHVGKSIAMVFVPGK